MAGTDKMTTPEDCPDLDNLGFLDGLGGRVLAALAEISFDKSTPSQSRVAALKELRDMLRDRPDAPKPGPGGVIQQDPGTLTLDQIQRELGTA